MVAGLVSVTFRKKTPEDICALCNRAGLAAIEWGGDVHVPPEDAKQAAHVRALSADHGLAICSYGSYYRAGQPLDAFRRSLETAAILGAPVIRVWAGGAGSAEVSEIERARIVENLLSCAEEAKAAGIAVGLEYHQNTLTDDRRSIRRLMEEIDRRDHPAASRGTPPREGNDELRFYWQPRFDWPEDELLASLDDLRGRLSHIHAFSYEKSTRLPLEGGERVWRQVIGRVSADQHILLEFVQNDADESLLRDAATLNAWIKC